MIPAEVLERARGEARRVFLDLPIAEGESLSDAMTDAVLAVLADAGCLRTPGTVEMDRGIVDAFSESSRYLLTGREREGLAIAIAEHRSSVDRLRRVACASMRSVHDGTPLNDPLRLALDALQLGDLDPLPEDGR